MKNNRKREKREIELLKPFLPKLKNYDGLFKILEQRFPSWNSIYAIQQKLNLIYPEDLERLTDSHFLEKQKFLVGEDKNNNPLFEYWFRLSPNGFSYLYNLNIKKLNRRIFWLTILLAILGLIQIILMIILN